MNARVRGQSGVVVGNGDRAKEWGNDRRTVLVVWVVLRCAGGLTRRRSCLRAISGARMGGADPVGSQNGRPREFGVAQQ